MRMFDTIRDEIVEQAEPALWQAVFADTATDETDALRVRIPGLLDRKLSDPLRGWMPRGDVLPETGDPALVAVAETGEPWIVSWFPASYED